MKTGAGNATIQIWIWAEQGSTNTLPVHPGWSNPRSGQRYGALTAVPGLQPLLELGKQLEISLDLNETPPSDTRRPTQTTYPVNLHKTNIAESRMFSFAYWCPCPYTLFILLGQPSESRNSGPLDCICMMALGAKHRTSTAAHDLTAAKPRPPQLCSAQVAFMLTSVEIHSTSAISKSV